jgi:hypothetical protein
MERPEVTARRTTRRKPYLVQPHDVLECEILAIVTDNDHGTSIMMRSENNGTFFAALGSKFYLWKREKPEEFAGNPHNWSLVNPQKYDKAEEGVRPV